MYNIQNNHFKEFKVSYPEIVLSIKSTASKLDAIYFFISGLELKKKKKGNGNLKTGRVEEWLFEPMRPNYVCRKNEEIEES